MNTATMKKVLTLCIVHQHPMVLLGMKKRGFGAGKWNGFGGKVEPGETIEEAARREVKEEAGIEVSSLEKHGVLEFEFAGNPEVLEVHVFRTEHFDGQPEESDEMRPQWFNVDELPFPSMWPDDPHWFPLFLEKKKFTGKFLFDHDNALIRHELKEAQGVA